MTDLLKQAFFEAEKLSAEEQDRLGEWLLSEIIAEKKWDELLLRESPAIDKMIEEAREVMRDQNTSKNG